MGERGQSEKGVGVTKADTSAKVARSRRLKVHSLMPPRPQVLVLQGSPRPFSLSLPSLWHQQISGNGTSIFCWNLRLPGPSVGHRTIEFAYGGWRDEKAMLTLCDPRGSSFVLRSVQSPSRYAS